MPARSVPCQPFSETGFLEGRAHMEFRALNKETMEVELSTDEIGELLRQNGWKKFELEAIPKVLIPAVVQIEEDLVG